MERETPLRFSLLFPAFILLLLVADSLIRGAIQESLRVLVSFAIAGVLYQVSRRIPDGSHRLPTLFRYVLPILFYGACYGDIHAMLTRARPWIVDASLVRIDAAIFGRDPIAWLGNLHAPWLTDILYPCYFLYYAGMPLLLILLWRKNMLDEMRTALAAMMIGWYGALVTYALFPALGPQRFHPETLVHIAGALPSTAIIMKFYSATLTPAVRDCVPSMHTGVTLLTLRYSFLYHPTFFRWYLVPGIGLIFATMYLQQHYVVDVLLGAASAGAILFLVRHFRLH